MFEINGIQCQVGVQFPGLAMLIHPVPVINAVGHIGGLLDLGQQHPGPDGMDPARGHVEDIPP